MQKIMIYFAIMEFLFCPHAFALVDASDIALIEDTDGSITQSAAMPNVYLSKASCAFYKQYPDAFDAIFVFTTAPLDMITNVQQGWPVKQDQKGIGRPYTNQTISFCSYKGRLRHAVKMGYLKALPDNPDDKYTGIFMYPLTGIQLMAHEFGHHWLASVRFDKKDGTGVHCILRGFEPMGEPQQGDCDGYSESAFNQHWSFYFNSRSLMYGSMIEDLGGGKFKFYYKDPKYSELDQYLMGLRAPEEVSPLFVVDVGDLMGSASLPLQPNSTQIVEGKRVDLTVQDIINVEGPREPKFDNCHWKAAMILVYPSGKKPTPSEIAKMVTYANRWEEFYAWATDGRGSIDLTIDGTGKGTEKCPAPDVPILPQDGQTEPVYELGKPEPIVEIQIEDYIIGEGVVLPDLDATDFKDLLEAEGFGDIIEDQVEKDIQKEFSVELMFVDHLKEGMVCIPSTYQCSDMILLRCLDSGTDWEFVKDCSKEGKVCSMGDCRGLYNQGKGSGGCGYSGGISLGNVAFLLMILMWLRKIGQNLS